MHQKATLSFRSFVRSLTLCSSSASTAQRGLRLRLRSLAAAASASAAAAAARSPPPSIAIATPAAPRTPVQAKSQSAETVGHFAIS